MLGRECWNGVESLLGNVALKERGLLNEVESKRDTLLKRGAVVRGVAEGEEDDGPEEARIT